MWSYIFCPHPNWTSVTNSMEEHLTSMAHFIPELDLGRSYTEQGQANRVTWAGIWPNHLGWESCASRVTWLQNNHKRTLFRSYKALSQASCLQGGLEGSGHG